MAAKRTESVERALSILMAFTSQQPRLSLANLAHETGLHKSTILRLVESLMLYGFLHKGEDGQYSVGASVWRLGLIFRQDFRDGEDIRPILRKLVSETGETASFYVRAGSEKVCLYRENSPNLIRFHLEEGIRMNLDSGATGMILTRHTTGQDLSDATFTQTGTAISVGHRNPNIASIAAPTYAQGGEFIGALAVSGLITRFDEAARSKAIPVLEAYAKYLSGVL